MTMDAADPSRESARLHVSTLLVASERALVNALDELGFAENDDRVIEHEGRFAFITCSHDPDRDDLFALISELAARGETWELQFRIATVLNRVDPAEVFVTLSSNTAGRALAVIVRRNPRGAIGSAEGADEASLRAAIREILPTVMFSVAMKPPTR